MAKVINYYEKMGSKIKSRYYNPHSYAIQHPARVVLVASSGAGKSNLILNIINTSKCWKKIYLVCANAEEKLYVYLKKKLGDGLVIIDDINDLPPLKATIKLELRKKKAKDIEGESEEEAEEEDSEEDKDEIDDDRIQKLIIFDDLSLESPAVTKKIAQYYTRGRNNNFSVITTAQNFYSLHKNLRLNANYAIFLRMNSLKDIKAIIKDYALDIQPDQLVSAYKEAMKGPYGSFFMIDLMGPYKFRINLDKAVVMPEND